MTEINLSYLGPSTVENYAFILNNHSNQGEKHQRLWKKYIGFSLKDKSFYLKNSLYDNTDLEIYHNKSIINFHDRVSEKEQMEYPNGYGFFILAGSKKFVIFLETEYLLKKWMRILNYYFYQIDVADLKIDNTNSNFHIETKVSYKNKSPKIYNYDPSLRNVTESYNELVSNEEIKNNNILDNNKNINNYLNNINYMKSYEYGNVDTLNRSKNNNDPPAYSLNKLTKNVFSENLYANNLRKFKVNPLSLDEDDYFNNFHSKKFIHENNSSPKYKTDNKLESIFKRESPIYFRTSNEPDKYEEQYHVPFFGNNKGFRSISPSKLNNPILDADNKPVRVRNENFSPSKVIKKEENENENKIYIGLIKNEENIKKNNKDYSKYDTYYGKTKINFVFEDNNENKEIEVLSKIGKINKKAPKDLVEDVNINKVQSKETFENKDLFNENFHQFFNKSDKSRQNISYGKNKLDCNPDFGTWDLSAKYNTNNNSDKKQRIQQTVNWKNEYLFNDNPHKNLENLIDDKNLHIKVKSEFNKINLENLHYGLNESCKTKKIEDLLPQSFSVISLNNSLNVTKSSVGLEIKRRQQLQEIYNQNSENMNHSTKKTPYVKVDGDSFVVNIGVSKNENANKNGKQRIEKDFEENYSKTNYDRLEQLKIKIKEKEKEEPIYLGKNKPPERFYSSIINDNKNFSYEFENQNNVVNKANNDEKLFNYYNNIDTNLDYKLNNTGNEYFKYDDVENPFKMNAQYNPKRDKSPEGKLFSIENNRENNSIPIGNYAIEIDKSTETKDEDEKRKNQKKKQTKIMTLERENKEKNFTETNKSRMDNKQENQFYLNNHDHHTPITKTIKIDEMTQLGDNFHLEIDEHKTDSLKENTIRNSKAYYSSNPSNLYKNENKELKTRNDKKITEPDSSINRNHTDKNLNEKKSNYNSKFNDEFYRDWKY